MWMTVAAMLPAAAVNAFFYGYGVLWQMGIAIIAALLSEKACLLARHRTAGGDNYGSAVLSGIIIGVCLPPAAPWFVAATAAIAGMTLAKHCYGGLGNNPFNPAMAGYALAFVCFPGHFDGWLIDTGAWNTLFTGVSAVTTPTPLAAARLGHLSELSWQVPAFAIASAVGGVFLLILRIADWRLVVGFLLGGLAIADNWSALLPGGFIFAAFFVVTDPTTAATTPTGRLLYAAAIGAIAAWLREYGPHTDGIAFAILLGNILAPFFDRLVWSRK